jgi:hypothetical protein
MDNLHSKSPSSQYIPDLIGCRRDTTSQQLEVIEPVDGAMADGIAENGVMEPNPRIWEGSPFTKSTHVEGYYPV